MDPTRRAFLTTSSTLASLGIAGCAESDFDTRTNDTNETNESETDDDEFVPDVAVESYEADRLRTIAPRGLDWTGRYVTEENLGWASYRNLSSSRFSTLFDAFRDRGYVIVDVGGTSHRRSTRYSMVWRENVDGRSWAERRNMSSSRYEFRRDQYGGQGLRPLQIDGYVRGGGAQYAAIWVENVEDIGFSAVHRMAPSAFDEEHDEHVSDGERLIDVCTYHTSAGIRRAGVWYENVDGLEWDYELDMDRDRYLEQNSSFTGQGYRTIDFESYVVQGTRRYSAIWVKPEESYAYQVRTDRSNVPYGNLWRRYLDMGYRLVDQEHYGSSSEDRFGGVWIENADRFRYDKKDTLFEELEEYRDDHPIPCLSVAIVEDGQMRFRRGVGSANLDEGREAHGETIYDTASIAKAFGGTLATRLESAGQLRDGTQVDLNLEKPLEEYLTNPTVPDSPFASVDGLEAWDDGSDDHPYIEEGITVEEVFAHLGCIPDYDTISDSTMRANHYETATEAAEKIWEHPLQGSCTVGDDREYATHGFTIGGAVLEQVTGRPITRLVHEELLEPLNLRNTRVMFETEELPWNSQRAAYYSDYEDDDDYEIDEYTDSSWKVLGGGIESTAVDLARFGWAVLDGQVVDETARDRMWTPVNDDCDSFPPSDSDCRYGVAWQLNSSSVRRYAEHGGSWTGAGTLLRIYPDDDLVIAMMSTLAGSQQPQRSFVTSLANEVLD